MSVSTSVGDYFNPRPSLRTRPPPNIRAASATSPRSPRTPLLGRSISSQLGSPGNFRSEQEDTVIYELNPRYLTAGFAGESRPRCIVPFTPESGRRVGDYRNYSPGHLESSRNIYLKADWGAGYELYRSDINSLDLGLVEDRLDRALRTAHTDYLQLDSKSRKAALLVASLFPTPLLEIAVRVIFNHFAQPPSITVLTHPILNCVGAGLRDALIVDIGWEETAVTAVGEYREVLQRRSIRAGKFLTQQIASVIEHEARQLSEGTPTEAAMTFAEADELTQQMAWCRGRQGEDNLEGSVQLPMPGSKPPKRIPIQFDKFAEATEGAFFSVDKKDTEYDDHDLPLDLLVYRVLLALPPDLRTICLSRIIVSGSSSSIPGLKRRILHELTQSAESRSWDAVQNYGSASTKRQQERSANTVPNRPSPETLTANITLSPMKMPIQDTVPHADRVHDDIQDPVTLKAERDGNKSRKDVVSQKTRGVETLGSWAGASMMISLRVKGHCEIERDDFIRHGLRNAFTSVL